MTESKGKYAIKNSRGTFYRGHVKGIGPMFGGTEQQAARFADKLDACDVMGTHSFAFADCDVVELK